jgi:hypothetical protein
LILAGGPFTLLEANFFEQNGRILAVDFAPRKGFRAMEMGRREVEKLAEEWKRDGVPW